MSNHARRVVLLARPGAARDRMREALDQAGANIVLEADPAATDQATVLASQPQMALIVLDASTDEALDRFDGVLSDPAIEVLFEEAEHAVGRVGWDAARWVRHLRAKLGLADTVLPPGREAEAQDLAVPAPVAAVVVPATPVVTAVPPEMPPLPEMPPPLPELALLDNDEVAPIELHTDMELVTVELGDEAAHYVHEHGADALPPFVAKLDLELADATPSEIRIEGLELEEDHAADSSRFHNDMVDLHSRIAAMELVEDRTKATTRGVVLVMAGIGGPDAVRQLLGALPERFPQPVLVQQRLDGGHYDKLVAQMQRATALPVKLAASGDAVAPATVYILPPTLGVQQDAQGLAFNDLPADLLASLPANDSAVLLLSGADPAQVDAVMKMAGAGALVAGQSLDGCYDVAAPAALASRGGQAGKPQDLARRLAERWH
ncbi:chemotaxis protein CheB [Lysobacter solisilvae (ex Woo and Kim 2020)]|uniref:protein-glutamate methylesterase n=1 Tax=Agrilutibacter terrestris TaxID=2865112 RepID=A0A7H0FYZ7_9GAMM|nr:chemotaxis protein CheB [Lysobacter terrestris]QNP41263.1 chemotaxis protein [Lysobacter terrestris]